MVLRALKKKKKKLSRTPRKLNEIRSTESDGKLEQVSQMPHPLHKAPVCRAAMTANAALITNQRQGEAFI